MGVALASWFWCILPMNMINDELDYFFLLSFFFGLDSEPFR